MNKDYLLQYRFKRIGMWMFIPFFTLCFWLLFIDDTLLENLTCPCIAICIGGLGSNEWFKIETTQIIDEIGMLGLLISLCFISLSKEKDEDEMTAVIRMQSFVWSLWVTAFLLAFGILFLYEFSFVSFSFAAIFFVFLTYIFKFNLTMKKIRRDEK